MPYSKSNKKIQDSAFKMSGYSYPGLSPMKKNNHPVVPPTKEQADKSKGTLKEGRMINHGRWNRPEVFSEMKRTYSEKYKALKKKLGY